MSLNIKTLSLSTLTPVELYYGFDNKEDKLAKAVKIYNNEFSFVKHGILSGYKDIAFSRGNLLALTDTIPFSKILDTTAKVPNTYIGNQLNNTSFKLKTEDGLVVKKLKNRFYVGGTGEDVTFTLVVISPNVYEMKISNNIYVEIDQTYPYDMTFSDEIIDETEFHRRRFEIDFWENKMTIKCKVSEGYRYISFGVDNVLRGNGVYLNKTVMNSYTFIPEFVSENIDLVENKDILTPTEVFYINDISGEVEHENLTIGRKEYNDTNALVTCSLEQVVRDDKAKANIALLKNNFTAAGAYTTK